MHLVASMVDALFCHVLFYVSIASTETGPKPITNEWCDTGEKSLSVNRQAENKFGIMDDVEKAHRHNLTESTKCRSHKY